VSLNKQTYKLPKDLAGGVAAALEDWKKNNKVARLWQKDASLWTGADESNWLGWLTITQEQLANVDTLKRFAAEVKKARFKHALLLGMGGSSLCPEVLRMTFGKIKGFPELHVLDSTDPAQIRAVEASVDLKSTLCIVSSKSGSTLEPNSYKQ
jgi:transaldolase / glucose-6-phosphate isomerase